jgi:hypothetical protein
MRPYSISHHVLKDFTQGKPPAIARATLEKDLRDGPIDDADKP